ncbi:TonB-dependent siderophore receptor [Caulobacter sp. 17J80-11]|uniref:TonB-dependent receptor plug domain-containing protein n=1 Tax=Caulobacter sp. 17J80-11 TaxID=2763502 RepID=UPI0016535681|nr:TonB-dependent receptor [Caulobacter sp. 17J80-11]MBC6982211.1 TonB-dependent receptor [Caulobacter sp. 17J80-11]
MKRIFLLAALAAAAAAPAYAQTADAAAPAATQGVTVYPPEFFADSRPNSAWDMINRIPGFAFDNGAQVRGYAGAAGNVLIDGKRPTTKAEALSDVLNRIQAGDVERIELIRGGAPGIDMQGRNIIANVIRKKTDSFQQTGAVGSHIFFGTGKMLPALRYEFTRRSGDTTIEGQLSRGVSMDDSVGHGQRTFRDGTGAVTGQQEAFTEGDGGPLGAKASIKTPLFGGEFRSNVALASNDFKYEDHFYTSSSKTDVVEKSVNKSVEIGVNYDRPLTERLSLETLALQKLGDNTYGSSYVSAPDGSYFTSDSETGESIVRGVLRFQKSPTLTFEGGGEAAFNFRESQVRYAENGTDIPLPSADVRAEERRGEVFAQANWRPSKQFTVEAGARFESSTISSTATGLGVTVEKEESFFYPKPRVLATWSPNEENQLRLRVEREVGQLNFGDFVASANLSNGLGGGTFTSGNSSLVPDKTWVYEAAYERHFWGDGALVLTLRHQQITDAIDRVPIEQLGPDGPDAGTDPDVIAIFDGPGNIGDGVNNSLQVDLTLPLDRLKVKGGEFKVNYTLNDSEVTDPTTGEKRPISGLRPQSTEVNFRQDLPELKLTWGMGWFGGWEETYWRFNEIQHLDIWNFYSAFVEWKPDGKTSFLFEIDNLDPFEFTRERTVYDAPRDTGSVAGVESFTTQSQLRAYVRVRRTF